MSEGNKDALMSKDELHERTIKTLTTGKDVVSPHTEDYPLQSPLLGFLGNPDEEEVMGMTDPLTNEIIVLKLPERFRSWEEPILVNEENHSFVICGNPQRILLLFGQPYNIKIDMKQDFIMDWKCFLESMALSENLLHALPSELRQDIGQRLEKNAVMLGRISMIKEVLNKFTMRTPQPQIKGEEVTKLLRMLGYCIGSLPLILMEQEEITVVSIYDKVLESLSKLIEEEIPQWHTFKEVESFFVNYFIYNIDPEMKSYEKVTYYYGGLFPPTVVNDLVTVLASDGKSSLKPFILGILHNFNLIGSTIYHSNDLTFRTKRIIRCKIPIEILERRKQLLGLMATLRDMVGDCESAKKKKLLLDNIRVYEKLSEVQTWIYKNCLRDCVGKEVCPVLKSGRVYDLIKKLLCGS